MELTENDIEKIKKMVEKEFPNDPALQQVHIARKIIAKEAELRGMSFLEYIKSLRKQVQDVSTQYHFL
jgi:hypothetical protein